MRIEVRYFASAREALGCDAESLTLPDDIATVGQVRAYLCRRGGIWSQTLGEQRAIRMACDHQMAQASTAITEGCEIAFFPPVTGG